MTRLDRMRPAELAQAAERGVPFVLPIGVMEYHGRHLPSGVDTIVVTEGLHRDSGARSSCCRRSPMARRTMPSPGPRMAGADLDEDKGRNVERVFAREDHLIALDDRLDAIATDLVQHFVGRGVKSKGMMICIDNATAVRMHDKGREQWEGYRRGLETRLAQATEKQCPVIQA